MNKNKTPAWKRQGNKREFTIGHLEVYVRNNDIDKAIRDLKNKMNKEGILAELKKRRHYEKPSDVKRKKKREAIKKAKIKLGNLNTRRKKKSSKKKRGNAS